MKPYVLCRVLAHGKHATRRLPVLFWLLTCCQPGMSGTRHRKCTRQTAKRRHTANSSSRQSAKRRHTANPKPTANCTPSPPHASVDVEGVRRFTFPCVRLQHTANSSPWVFVDAHGIGNSPWRLLPCVVCREQTHGEIFAVGFSYFAVCHRHTA
jgi:hypothetical protein